MSGVLWSLCRKIEGQNTILNFHPNIADFKTTISNNLSDSVNFLQRDSLRFAPLTIVFPCNKTAMVGTVPSKQSNCASMISGMLQNMASTCDTFTFGFLWNSTSCLKVTELCHSLVDLPKVILSISIIFAREATWWHVLIRPASS